MEGSGERGAWDLLRFRRFASVSEGQLGRRNIEVTYSTGSVEKFEACQIFAEQDSVGDAALDEGGRPIQQRSYGAFDERSHASIVVTCREASSKIPVSEPTLAEHFGRLR